MKLSIIIVQYKVKKELFDCLRSIKKANTKMSYEVIVVDNDEEKSIEKELKKQFPDIVYIKSPGNIGFGAGNNLGARKAKGEYLFFLNPDTIVKKDAINKLCDVLTRDKKLGIVAPLLLDPKNEPYPLQGSTTLSPKTAVFSLSLVAKIWKNNPVYKKYYLADWDKKSFHSVDVVPGTAFMIARKFFEKIGGFDEHFFLYFEESDLCKRIREMGYKIGITPKARVVHLWGKSTEKSQVNIKKIFSKSRFYYFKKHYGLPIAIITNFLLSLSGYDVIFLGIFLLGIFLRFYNLQNNFYFDAEIGDNLLDIKNALVAHQIPLLGSPTSHPWLYFGPLFYWIYGPILALFKFDPMSYGYFGAFIASLTVFANYIVIKRICNKRVATLSSFLIAISSLFLQFSLWARFFSFVPLLVYPFLLLTYKTTNIKKHFFALGLLFGLMLNFHYTPLVLLPFLLSFFLLEKVRICIKDIILFVAGTIIPLIPFFIYDGEHTFSMSKNLLLWIPYRILGFVGLYHKNTVSGAVLKENVFSFQQFFSASFLPPAFSVGYFLAAVLLLFVVIKFWQMFKNNYYDRRFLLIVLWGAWGLIGVFVHGNPPPHYFVPILAFPIILSSLLLDELFRKKIGTLAVLLLLVVLTIVNLRFFFSNAWFYHYRVDPFPYGDRVTASKFIIQDAHNKKFTLHRIGYNDQFRDDYAQNYMYLLWYFGNEPVRNANIHYTIYDGITPKKVTNKQFLLHPAGNIYIVKSSS